MTGRHRADQTARPILRAPDESQLDGGRIDGSQPGGAPSVQNLQAAAVHGSLWTSIAALAGLPFSVVSNLIVARTLGPGAFGTVATYIAVYGIFVAVLDFGVGGSAIQWLARSHAKGERDELVDLCRRCFGFRAYVETPAMIIAVEVLLQHQSFMVRAVAGTGAAVAALLTGASTTLAGVSLNSRMAKLSLGINIAMQVGIVVTALTTHAAGPTWAARLIFSMFGPIFALALLPGYLRRANLRPRLPRHWPLGFVSYSAKGLISGLVASLVFSRSEVLILNAYHLTVATGLFALAAGLAVQITAPLDAMLSPLIPAAAALLEVGSDRAKSAILRGLRLSSVAMVPLVSTAVPGVALLIPTVYGDRFSDTGNLFVALAVVSCLQTVLHPVTAFVIALRMPMLRMALNASALVVDLGLVAAFAMRLGATGAVMGNAVGQVVSLGAAVLVLRKYLQLPIKGTMRAVVPFILASAVGSIAAALGLAYEHRGGSIALSVVVLVPASTIVAIILVRLSRTTLEPADLDAIRRGLPSRAKSLVPILAFVAGTARGAAVPPRRHAKSDRDGG